MSITIIIVLLVLGLCAGSFAGATVWRLRARQLVADKKSGEKVNEHDLKRLRPLATGAFGHKDRSRCLNCGYQLKWYDLIPLVSWITLRGKCRKCRKSIGWFEPLMEIGVAAYFIGSYILWPDPLNNPIAITQLVVWLLAGVSLAILFAYDAKWFLLPDSVNTTLWILGIVSATLVIIDSTDKLAAISSIVSSVGILSGLYLLLYMISKGNWVGFGDVKLGFGLGLLLADWRLAVIGLFAANFVGTLIVLPGMVAGKIKAQSRIPFGPLLIAGTIIAKFTGIWLIGAYASALIL